MSNEFLMMPHMQFVMLGDWKSSIKHNKMYFIERGTFLDCRGEIEISASSMWGFENKIITASHSIKEGTPNPKMITNRGVFVRDFAWVTSFCVLYNCTIGEHAVVSIGSVVANMDVEPCTMVAGNPAKVIKIFQDGEWICV